jgi:hypothetical protein
VVRIKCRTFEKIKTKTNKMELNTVTLKLERYHELLSYETKVNEPRAHTVFLRSIYGRSEIVQTDDEVVKLIAEELSKSIDEVSKKDAEIKKVTSQLENKSIGIKSFFRNVKLLFKDNL